MKFQEELSKINDRFAHIGLDDKIDADMSAQDAALKKFSKWRKEGHEIYVDENGFKASGWTFEDDINSDDDDKAIEAQNKLEHVNDFYTGAYEDELEGIERKLAEKMIEPCKVYVFVDPDVQIAGSTSALDDNGGEPDGNAWIVDNIGDAETAVEPRDGWHVNDYSPDRAIETEHLGKWCGFSSRGEAFTIDKETAIAIAIEIMKVNYSEEED
jgi:hypothetical protein